MNAPAFPANPLPAVRPQRASAFTTPALALMCLVVVALLSLDAFSRPRDWADERIMRAIQRIDLPGFAGALRVVEAATGHIGALSIWAALLVLFILLRWWLAALTLAALPVGGLLNHLLSIAVQRGPADDGDTVRAIGDADAFLAAGGHVVGAVLLYGILYVAVDHLADRPVRRAIKAVAVFMMLVVGLAEVRYGASWPSDVTAAYALGGLLLLGVLAIYRRIDAVVGDVPFVHAAIPPHDERIRHAHALTSLVLFEGQTVEKIYAPGFVPRVIYWFAFQAEFPYMRNLAALRAAMHRRNLAAMLTEYWYGAPRVARVVSIEPSGDRFGVRSELVDGHEPADKEAARRFLHELKDHFEEVGYPTWQIDPRQPRAVDNVLETADGGYMIVDLESGLVSPLASLRSWARAFRRGLVPIFDDVYFDLTRAYVERKLPRMIETRGTAWAAQLQALLCAAEAETTAWRRSEPRIWSRLVYALQHGFDLRNWPGPMR